tara:strand:+ start:4444 stop:7641 length:3198 start_codon:yes stop_codon:yes gene_type:complete
MELNQDYISTLSNEQLEGVLPQLSGDQYSAIEGVLARRQGFSEPIYQPEKIDVGWNARLSATNNILSGQFIRDIDTQLQEENILPFNRPETTGGFMPMMPMGGSPMSMKNPGYSVERNRRIKEGLLSNLSSALDVDESKIDISSGLGDVLNRSLLSFQEDTEGKFDFLADRYGKDNVTQFSIGNKPSFLVKKGDTQVLVDEQGAAFGDVLDLARPAVVLGAELGASLLLPGATAPGMLAKMPVATRAAYAGLGAAGGEVVSEGIESFSDGNPDTGFKDIEFGQSAARGATAAAFDYGFSKPFTLAAKAFTAPGVRGTDVTYEDFLEVLQRMEQRTGVDIAQKATPSMRAGSDATIREGEVVDALRVTGVSDDMQAPLVQGRMAFNDALSTIIKVVKGEEVPFEQIARIGEDNFKALSKAALDLGDESFDMAAKATSKYFDNLAENVLPTLQRKTSKELGEDLQVNVLNIFRTNKAQVDSLYDEALSMGDDIDGIDMLSAARRIINMDALVKELPGGANDQIIRSFIPKNVLIQLSKAKDLSKQARARLKQIAEFEDYKALFQEGDQMTFMPLLEGIAEVTDPGEPLKLTFRNLVNAKKQLNQVYGQAARGDYLAKKQLRSMIDGLDGLLEGMAKDADSDAFNVLKDANKLWKEKSLPLLEDRNLQSILGNTKTKLSPGEISEALLRPRKGQVQGLVALRNAAPDPEEFSQTIRNSAIDLIFNAAENQGDSLISLPKLKDILKNNDLVDEFFDKQTIKRLQKIANVYSGKYSKDLLGMNIGGSVTPSTLKKLLESGPEIMTPAEKSVILGKLNDEASLSLRVKAIGKNEAFDLLKKGFDLSTDNTNSMVNALLSLKSAADVEQFMSVLDEPAREAIRASVRARIFDGASLGSGSRTGEMFGGSKLPDIDAKIFEDLRKSKSTPREVALKILGEDGLQDVLDIATILDRVGRENQIYTTGLLKANQGQFIARGGSAASKVMPRVILGVNLDVPINKFLGIALANENYVNFVNAGRPSDFTLSMLPAIYSSDNAFQLFTQMASEDPRLIGRMNELASDAEVEASGLLK